MYVGKSRPGNRPPAHNPIDTAGLKWPPDTGPSAYARVSTVSPNASDTPAKPMPRFGNAAASTALPQPPRTSQNVPRNSQTSFANINALRYETRSVTNAHFAAQPQPNGPTSYTML